MGLHTETPIYEQNSKLSLVVTSVSSALVELKMFDDLQGCKLAC